MESDQILIGIRREDKSVWERRVTLNPADMKQIIDENPQIKFFV
jgi:hypothetical protein